WKHSYQRAAYPTGLGIAESTARTLKGCERQEILKLARVASLTDLSAKMNLHVGTSGYSYKEWKGNFYPEDLPAKEMLSFYSRRLPAVEINNTFYRLPQASMIENWKAQVPDEFRF